MLGRLLVLFVFASCCLAARATEPKPKHVFVHADCSGSFGSAVTASLRDTIRASAGYQLATSLADDGGYGVVITLYLECTESRAPSGEIIASIASVGGRATCTNDSCNVYSDESSLQASLCSGNQAEGCGKDIYNELDEWMNRGGGRSFDFLSQQRTGKPKGK